MDVLTRNNVRIQGSGASTIVFAHGFGCDQTAWRDVERAFRDDHRTVLFDYVGAGGSDLGAFDPRRYSSLHGYAADLIEVLEAVGGGPALLVGHSVGGMIALLAAIDRPELVSGIVMVCPSPRYIDDGDYRGGFSREDIDELLEVVDSNFLGWSRAMAPLIMGNDDRPELGSELTGSFCRTDPAIASQFARVTFLSDHRADLAACPVQVLVLQTARDMIAPVEVGQYTAAHLPQGRLVLMKATGHCPHMSAPAETIAAIRQLVPEPVVA